MSVQSKYSFHSLGLLTKRKFPNLRKIASETENCSINVQGATLTMTTAALCMWEKQINSARSTLFETKALYLLKQCTLI